MQRILIFSNEVLTRLDLIGMSLILYEFSRYHQFFDAAGRGRRIPCCLETTLPTECTEAAYNDHGGAGDVRSQIGNHSRSGYRGPRSIGGLASAVRQRTCKCAFFSEGFAQTP